MSKLISFLIILSIIVGGGIFWQNQADSNQAKIDAETMRTYISALGEVAIVYPKEWEATENSGDIIDEGLYTLELESPRSDVAVAAVKEKLDFDLRNINEVATDAEFIEALNSPQADQFSLIELNTASASVYELFAS